MRALGYLLLAVLITWPLALHLGDASVGFPGVDAEDTATLRGLVADWLLSPRLEEGAPLSGGVYHPIGYPVFGLIPNLLDHLSGAPLDWLLPYPWSDNLWWLLVLTLNGLAGHRLGRTIGGTEGHGWLAGVALLSSEPLLREVNLHHAPQAMLFWGPLAVESALRLRAQPGRRQAVITGLWLAGAGLSYWYYGLFLGAGLLPLLLLGRPRSPGEPGRPPLAEIALVFGVAGLLCAPFLLPILLGVAATAVSGGGRVPPPVGLPDSYALIAESERFVAQHGNDLLFWWRAEPIDTSSRIALTLLVAVGLALPRWRDRGARAGLLVMSALGCGMLLGPWLRWGEGLAELGGEAIPLPFRWVGSLHPALARLTWPERWALIVPLGLTALAALAPRPRLLAGLILLEGLLRSGNLPVQITSLKHQTCWAELSGASGAILELPLAREALDASRPGVHRRFHGRPLVNPLLLPPGARPPERWRTWAQQSPLMRYLESFERGRSPEDPGAAAVRALRADGVSAIAVDAEPGAVLTRAELLRYRAGLGRHLGAPIDLGCALVWWLDTEAPAPRGVDDGDAWRAEAEAWKKLHPVPTLPTLMAAEGPERID